MAGYASADASMAAQSTSLISGAAETALPPAPSYSPYADDNHAQVCVTSVVTIALMICLLQGIHCEEHACAICTAYD